MEELKKLELGIFLMESTSKFKEIVKSHHGRFESDEIDILRAYGEMIIKVASNANFINKLESQINEMEKTES